MGIAARLVLLVLAVGIGSTPLRAAAPVAAGRGGRVQELLPAESLAQELDERFGIWFVGGQFPPPTSVTLPKDATPEQALALVRAALKGQPGGCQIDEVPGSDHKVFQISRISDTLRHYQFGKDPATVPVTPSDEIISQVVPLAYLSPGVWQDYFVPTRVETGSYEHSGIHHPCVILTDTAAKIHLFMEIIAKFDVQKPFFGDNRINYRQLVYVDAADVARELKQRYARPLTAAPATVPAELPPRRFWVDYDTRTNTVVYDGPVDLVNQAEADANKMDADAKAGGAKPRIPTPARDGP